ncbi:MerR family DNA-binding protein [Nodosilinea sp. LEGE 07088]|uniref:MerR family DNA-binding protein n=1 Tax=Nodosilinea sp. LEGE 07088 TaxID=2777968 RepID=UPI0018829431|nr:MerR family DNA-binding protein [Nodosilinea sp. LEGE 07088]MBE9135694.1 MerR family DNA-binding protein [Nodosilinea sp. LEGE 07088]
MSAQDKKLFFIGQIAKLSGISITTIRYYEDLGLIKASGRTDSGFRQFSLKVLSYLEFIKQCQSFGLSLQEIKELFRIYDQQSTLTDETKRRLEDKILMLDNQIEALISLQAELKKLLSERINQ